MDKKESKVRNIKTLGAKILVIITVIGFIFTIFDKQVIYKTLLAILECIHNIYPVLTIVNLILLIVAIVIIRKNNFILNGERAKNFEKACEKLEESNRICSQNIKNFENIQLKMATYGIFDVDLRESYSNEFYKRIYQNTTKNLIISGHSLNNTINKNKSADLRSVLKKAIIRVLKNGGTVKILLQTVIPGDGAAVKKRNGFNEFIKELVENIIAASNTEHWNDAKTIPERLLIKQIDDLRYLVIQTDYITLISHYKMRKYNDNKNIYVFTVDPDEKYGACYLEDFNYVFDKCSNFIDESMVQINRLVEMQ